MSNVHYYKERLDTLLRAKSRLHYQTNLSEIDSSSQAKADLRYAQNQYDAISEQFTKLVKHKVIHINTMAWNIVKKKNYQLSISDQIFISDFNWVRNPDPIIWGTLKFSECVNNELLFEYQMYMKDESVEIRNIVIPLAWLVGDDRLISDGVSEDFYNVLNATRARKCQAQTPTSESFLHRTNNNALFYDGIQQIRDARAGIKSIEADISHMNESLETKKSRLNALVNQVLFSSSNNFKIQRIVEVVVNVIRKENRKVSQKLDAEVVVDGLEWANNFKAFNWKDVELHNLSHDSIILKFNKSFKSKTDNIMVIPLRWINLSDSEIIMEVREKFKDAARASFAKKYTQDLERMEAEAQELEDAAARLRKTMKELIDN